MHFSKRSLQSVFPSAPFFYVAMFESTEKQREQLRLLVHFSQKGFFYIAFPEMSWANPCAFSYLEVFSFVSPYCV